MLVFSGAYALLSIHSCIPHFPLSFNLRLVNKCFNPQVILVFLQHLLSSTKIYVECPFPPVHLENSLFFQNWHKHLILCETLPDLPKLSCFFSLLRSPLPCGYITIIALISLYCAFVLYRSGSSSTAKLLEGRNCLNYADSSYILVPST